MNGLKKINIGVLGASGKVGKEIVAELNRSDECNLFYSYSRKNENNDFKKLCMSEVVIDFSSPEATIGLIEESVKHNTKIVCGTTGFSTLEFTKIKEASRSIPILYAPNMSIGINLIKKLLEILNQNLSSDFCVDIIDMHHKNKKDKPSGTALMFEEFLKPRSSNIIYMRAGEIFGTHELYFTGNNEQIIIKHQALSRKVYAEGSIKAAIFLSKCSKPGLYNMDDLFNSEC